MPESLDTKMMFPAKEQKSDWPSSSHFQSAVRRDLRSSLPAPSKADHMWNLQHGGSSMGCGWNEGISDTQG